LEGLRGRIQDTGELIQIDRAALQKAVHDGQIHENVEWANTPELDSPSTNRSSPAGYLPKQKPLMYRLDYHEMARQRAASELDLHQIETVPKELRDYIELLGRIKECDDWLKVQDEHGDWGTLVVGKEGREAKMPTLGSRADVEAHIKNRHLSMGFLDEETVKGERKKVYRGIAQAHSDAVDRENAEQEREA